MPVKTEFNPVEMIIPPNIQYVGPFVMLIESLCSLEKFNSKDIKKIALGFEEAFRYATEKSMEESSPQSIHLNYQRSHTYFQISISYKGKKDDASKVFRNCKDENIALNTFDTLGLFCTSKMFDEVTLKSNYPDLNIMILKKNYNT